MIVRTILKYMLLAVIAFLTIACLQLGVFIGAVHFGAPFIAAFTVVVTGLFIAFVVTSIYAVVSGAPFVPSMSSRVQTMLDLADVKPGDRLVDLGSGDGRLVVEAARRGAYAEGWEISPYLWLYSAVRIRLAGLHGRAKVHLGSYWPVHTGTFDVVTLYLLEGHMRRMEDKLMGELGQGSRVVSNAFRFPGWPQHRAEGHVYLYLR